MPRFKVFFSALLLLFWWLIPLNALAVTEYTWIYAGDGNWNEATKWSGGIVPGVPGNSAHQVWIDSSPGANVSVYVNVSPSISGLKLDMGDNLYVNSNYGLNLSQDDLGKNPTVSNQGTIHVNSSGSLIASAAQVTLTGSGSVVMHGSNAGLTQSGSGSFINDSDLTIRGSGGIYAPITNRGSIIAENGILTLSSTGVINQGVMTTSAAAVP